MRIEFDAAKNARNLDRHGISFELVEEFDWDSAITVEDLRLDYREARRMALGYLRERLHVVVFVIRGDSVRVISLRRANRREAKRYGQATRHANRP